MHPRPTSAVQPINHLNQSINTAFRTVSTQFNNKTFNSQNNQFRPISAMNFTASPSPTVIHDDSQNDNYLQNNIQPMLKSINNETVEKKLENEVKNINDDKEVEIIEQPTGKHVIKKRKLGNHEVLSCRNNERC